MNPNSRRGAIDLAALAVLALVLGIGGLFWKTSRLKLFDRGPSAAEVQKQLGSLEVNRAAVDAAVAAALAAERAARDEQIGQTRTGQAYVAGTGQALAGAGAAAKADPAVKLAGKLNAKAGEALEAAVGSLTPAQQQWVNELIANATSASEARRAIAEHSLRISDQNLRASEARESEQLKAAAAAQSEAGQLRASQEKLKTALTETLAEKDRVSGLLDTVLHWALYLGIGYVCCMYVLPLVGAVFPIMRPIATGIHAVVAPLGAKALKEAQELARDASAALHNVVEHVKAKAPELSADVARIKGEWITQNDGTAARHDEALREAQQL